MWPDPDDDAPAMRGCYPEWHLRAAVDAALYRLGVDRLDLLQLHRWFRSGTDELDWLETLNALRAEGKIDQIGVSIRDYRPDEGVVLAQLGLVASIQVVFNMFEQRPADALFPAGVATGTAFIGRVPLDSGALVGHWNEDTYAFDRPATAAITCRTVLAHRAGLPAVDQSLTLAQLAEGDLESALERQEPYWEPGTSHG
jgi:aryl-alcohol dehydrogenase-like predicted oxidoreductase